VLLALQSKDEQLDTDDRPTTAIINKMITFRGRWEMYPSSCLWTLITCSLIRPEPGDSEFTQGEDSETAKEMDGVASAPGSQVGEFSDEVERSAVVALEDVLCEE
jgi:hypothetical protein